LYGLSDRANFVIYCGSKLIMPEKYLVGKNKTDICKVIDYVMIIRNSLDNITMKCPDTSKDLGKIKTATNKIEELICEVTEK